MLKHWLLFLSVLLPIIGAGFYADKLNYQRHLQSERETVRDDLNLLRAKVEGNIQTNLQTVQGLLGLIINEPYLDQTRFSEFAAPIINDRNQVKNIGLAPDMVIQMVYPLKGNEGAIGLDFTKNEAQRKEAELARDTGTMIIAGPINLVQGGQGFIGRIPVFLNSENADSEKLFWGLISTVIDAERFYQSIEINQFESSLNIVLSKQQGDKEVVFYGEQDILNGEYVSVPAVLPNTQWTISARPKSGWSQQAPNAWWLRIFYSAFVIAIVILFGLLSRKNTQLALQETRLRSLFELSPIGIALNDFETGAFIELNEALYKPTGYSKSEFTSLSYWDLTPKEYEQQEADQLKSLKETGRYGPYEKEYIRQNGERYPVLLNGVLIEDKRGKKYIWSIVENISAQKQYEQDLISARIQAEAAATAKSEFLATMSHEIRTPMNGVLGMLDLLSRTSLDKKQSHQLSIAKSSAGFLLALIDDILDFSKIEAGMLELENRGFNITNLIEDIVHSFRPQVEEKNLYLKVDTDNIQHRLLSGDIVRVRQILTNLVGNAFKFTESGGITIDCKVSPQADKWRLKISVSDTGIGIAEEKLVYLFDAFTQVDASTTRKYGGSGLGLAICKQLCQKMGGDISVISKLGEGSQFTFEGTFEPASEEFEDKAVETTITGENEMKDTQVFLVEDNAFNREVVGMLLDEVGIKVTAAENGLEAIKKLNQSDKAQFFQIILMDCQMPEMDGYEASRKIREGVAGEEYKDIPIIALTANVMEGDKEKCLAAGMSDYLSKPIDGELLIEKIQQWLG